MKISRFQDTSPMKLCEWVPNFSEGRDKEIIAALKSCASSVEGASLLHADSSADANRTVLTVAGNPDALLECAFKTCSAAAELIDMSKQSGEHPRSGSIDVAPFIPLSGISEQDTIDLCIRFGKKIWDSLNIPVYLYAKAARQESRKWLPRIRKGGYEALPEKLKQEVFCPDIGDAVFNSRNGVMVTGVRDIMLAWNISLQTKDVTIAEAIAGEIRESGKGGIPGKFPGVQAKGWLMENYGCAQVTCNLHNPEKDILYRIFTVVSKSAAEKNTRVSGSEIIGLVPESLLFEAGRLFGREKKSRSAGKQDYVNTAVRALGLDLHRPFCQEDRILNRLVKKYFNLKLSL